MDKEIRWDDKFEKIVVEWLLVFIGPKLDWGQYGGVKGCSISHLMVELLTFIHYNLDLRKRHGVTLTTIDYSKAFNRQDHNNFLNILFIQNKICILIFKARGWL